jgi:hypothetical protein
MSEATIEQIHQIADRMGWEVETTDSGEIVLQTGIYNPSFDRAERRQMRSWEAKDAQDKRDMLGR